MLAIAVFLVLVFAVLWWLDVYTNHGQQVEVPDVKGLQVEEAVSFFQGKTLKYEVIDSTFVKNKPPGSILETIPPVGTKVKEGRTIYITINAHSAQLLSVPSVNDTSQRQAFAMLKSLGFEDVEIKLVPGPYKDLVMGLETRGRVLAPGDRIPADASLSILVSSGSGGNFLQDQEIFLQDSIADTSWF